MKKKLFTFIFTFVLLICFSVKVEALCTSKRYSNLKMLAYKSEVSYELNFDEKHNPYFLLTVNNVDKDVLVMFSDMIYEPVDGIVKIPTRLTGGTTYEVKLYGGYNTACIEEYLYTKNIAVPKYNKFSERDECIEYEEFYLCNKWYPGVINDEKSFENELDAYIKSLTNKEEEKKPEKEKSIFEKAIDFYTNNLIFTLPITILIVLFIGYKVVVKIIRRRNRIKLNI